MSAKPGSFGRSGRVGRWCLLAIGVALAMALPQAVATACASPGIGIHVSVKLIRDPATGQRPPTANGLLVSDADLDAMIQTANDTLLSTYWRGYRFVLDPVIEIGTVCSPCETSNPSYWYDVAFIEPYIGVRMEGLEDAALANAAYAWSTSAINVYVNPSGNGAVSSFPFAGPERSHEVVLMGSLVFNDSRFRSAFSGSNLHHELGHFFNLKHTNNGEQECSDTCSDCVGADDDSVSDTIEDRACWTQDDIAQHNFHLPYSALDPAHANLVDDVYENNMSYHDGGRDYGEYITYRLTEGQLDLWTDTANNKRAAVVRGRTWFVATDGSASGPGSSTFPFLTPQAAITAAQAAHAEGGDIVLLRPGRYYQNLYVEYPVTLRATRKGPVVVGDHDSQEH